jgi:nicotinate dehydrogenase subunit B
MYEPTSTRRNFLKTAGSLIVTFALTDGILPAQAQGAAETRTLAPDEVDAFLSINTEGQVTVYTGKVDLGTGIRTALTQIAAEELDLPFDRVTVCQGDTTLTPDQGATWGSLSIQRGGMQVRRAAATARKALIDAAAQRFGMPAPTLTIENGLIKGKNDVISYAELIGGKTFSLKLDKDAPVKNPAAYAIVGKSVPRIDIPAKVTARFTYMQDFRVNGMLHGRVVRPLAIGANLESIDTSSLTKIPGVVKVVRERNFLGVVATTEWGAIQAARELKTTWSNWMGLPEQAHLWDYVRASKVSNDVVSSNVGSSTAALDSAPKRLAATYDFPIQSHGSLGPSCAVVEIKDEKVTCWSASQAPNRLKRQLAAMLELPPDDVHCIYVEGSGCYGRNGHEDAASDAALLSRAVDGRPVRVQWMRADEHGWDPKCPPTLVDLRAGLDDTDNVLAWESEFLVPKDGVAPVPLLAAMLAGLPPAAATTEPYGEFGAPLNPSVANAYVANTAIPYTFPNVKTVTHLLDETPFRSSWLRSPGRMQNTFANECFMDELAAAAGVDPLEFRLKYLSDARGIELLRRLASIAKWEQQSSARKTVNGEVATGRGVSYVKYELMRTYVGAVAEVEVNRNTGEIGVQRFYVAHDCGQIINPDGLMNQIEGNVIQSISRTLKEEIQFDRSAVTSLHWATYPILTFAEVPDVVIELIDRPTEPPWGAGEPASAVVPSAIANAVFAAVGVRLRSVPFTPAKVRAAIHGARSIQSEERRRPSKRRRPSSIIIAKQQAGFYHQLNSDRSP